MNFVSILTEKFPNHQSEINEYVDYISKNKLASNTSKEDVLYEIHHILPRSLFPEFEYEPENLVKLKMYDHFVAHFLIAKTKNPKMLYAFNMMNRAKKHFTPNQLDEAATLYSELKADFITMCKSREPSIMSEEGKKSISKFTKNKVVALNKTTGIVGRVDTAEFYKNRDKYTHHQDGTSHTAETKQKMSENGIKGKTCFTNTKTGQTEYHDAGFDHPDFIVGNTVQSEIASNRFKGDSHWTNTVTGESTRAKTSPGPDWIKKRSNFKNAFEGMSPMYDIRTGEKINVKTGEKTMYQWCHNKLLIETKDTIYTDLDKLAEPFDITGVELVLALRGKKISRRIANALKYVDMSVFSITTAKHLKQPHTKTIL